MECYVQNFRALHLMRRGTLLCEVPRRMKPGEQSVQLESTLPKGAVRGCYISRPIIAYIGQVLNQSVRPFQLYGLGGDLYDKINLAI